MSLQLMLYLSGVVYGLRLVFGMAAFGCMIWTIIICAAKYVELHEVRRW